MDKKKFLKKYLAVSAVIILFFTAAFLFISVRYIRPSKNEISKMQDLIQTYENKIELYRSYEEAKEDIYDLKEGISDVYDKFYNPEIKKTENIFNEISSAGRISSVDIGRMRPETVSREGRNFFKVQLSLSSDLPSFFNFIKRLESSPNFFEIENLRMSKGRDKKNSIRFDAYILADDHTAAGTAQKTIMEIVDSSQDYTRNLMEKMEYIKDLPLYRDPMAGLPVIEKEPEIRRVKPQVKLDGIIWDSESPAAVVNGQIVSRGDIINDVRIVEIRQESVVYRWDGRNYTLTMQR